MSKAKAPQKPWHKGLNPSKAATNPDRVAPKGVGNPRTKATIKRLQMYKAKPIRNKQGKIMAEAFHSKELPSNTRIQPDRRWFGPTRLIGQQQMSEFRDEMEKAVKNPYQFILKQKQLPMALLTDPVSTKRMHLLEVESFGSTFGPKSVRKRPKVQVNDLQELVAAAERSSEGYDKEKDSNIEAEGEERPEARLSLFDKGQSKRIWGELYKVFSKIAWNVDILLIMF